MEALENTGVAPRLFNFCKERMCIEMEKITLNTLDIWKILKGGDNRIIEFAKAEYNLKNTSDEMVLLIMTGNRNIFFMMKKIIFLD